MKTKNLLKNCFFFLLILCQCDKNNSITANSIETWFTSTTDAVDKSILQAAPETLLDLIKDIAKLSPVGKCTATLIDTTATSYSIGYSTPKQIRADSTYPLIIYLHGGTGTEVNTKGELAFEMLSPLSDSMQLFLVSPSANKFARWWSPSGLSRILQTLRFMTLHYPIDSRKIFLAGVSDGATGCWAAANTISGPFAGFFAISGYAGILPASGMELYPENLMQRPIYNINAGQDHLYPIGTVNQFLDYMTQSGIQVIRKVYPDEQHGFDYRNQEWSTMCNYIKQWSRPSFDGFRWNFVNGYPNFPANLLQWNSLDTDKKMVGYYYDSDTLKIQSKGLSSIIIEGTHKRHPFFTKNNNNTPVKTVTFHADNLHNLQLMKYSCFPFCTATNLIKIKL
jgi:hypothetical protein